MACRQGLRVCVVGGAVSCLGAMTTGCEPPPDVSLDDVELREVGVSPHSWCNQRIRIQTGAFEGAEPTYVARGDSTGAAGDFRVEHRPLDSADAEAFSWEVACKPGAPLYFRSLVPDGEGQARSWLSRPGDTHDGDIVARPVSTSVHNVGCLQAFSVNINEHSSDGYGISALGGGHSLWATPEGTLSFSTSSHDFARQVFHFAAVPKS